MHKTQSGFTSSVRSRSVKPTAETLLANYKKTVLPNGIRVVTEEISHVRSVALGVWLNVGSRDESHERSGISHFVEHMVFKGTRHYRTGQIARSLESVGGYLNAFTSKEHTCFYARVLDQHVERAIDVVSDLVQYPLFDPKELEKEKQVVLEELKNMEDEPDDLIYEYFDRSMFGDHPLGSSVIGRADSISSFDRRMLFEHFHRHYTPSQMVVAAAGNIDHNTMVKLVSDRFHSTGSKNGFHRKKATGRRLAPRMEQHEKPIVQAHVCMGAVAYGSRSRYRFPLLVLNTLLGEGMSSRLFQNIRERYGFAYSVYSFANVLSDTGTFGVYVGTDSANIDRSIELIHRELQKLRAKPVSKAELQRTQEQLKGTMMLSLESMSSRMMRLGSGELIFGEYVTLDSILRNIGAVTQNDVFEVAGTVCDESKFSTVIFKPGEKTTQKSEYESVLSLAAYKGNRRSVKTSKRKDI